MNEDINTPRTRIELIIIIILVFASCFLYYKWDTSVKAHDAYVKGQKTEGTIGDINKPSGEVTQKEKDLYPKIEANIKNLNKDIQTLNETIKRLEKNQVTKGQIYDKFKNKSASEISEFFSDNDFSNTIGSKQ